MSKVDELERRLKEQQPQAVLPSRSEVGQPTTRRHLVRSVLVIIDCNKSMELKDFKPSRIALTLQCIRFFVNKIFDVNPITYLSVAVAYEGICKPLTSFTTNNSFLSDLLDKVEVHRVGSLSLESCLKTAITMFEDVPLYSSKEVLLIQSSPSTKDLGDIFQEIEKVRESKVLVNIVSLIGKTYVFSKLAEACGGRYDSVSNEQSYYHTLGELTRSPDFKRDNVEIKLFRVGFCRKEVREQTTFCYCHIQEKYEIFVCLVCFAHLCKVPSTCVVCGTHIILPGDLYRHYELKLIELDEQERLKSELKSEL
jgi:transcription initiation factor TFIIH subunit 2